jgi:hypothetical protein
MDTQPGTRVQDRLAEVRTLLHPGSVRAKAIDALDDLFRSGSAPDPQPDGPLQGELLTLTVARPVDAAVRGIASLYMPWLGKSFDRDAQTGINLLKPSARTPTKVLWPSYQAVREMSDRLEVFPFRTRIDTGAVDPALHVLKIDYDFSENPDFIIRRILDELVQIDEGLYLGKILFRTKKAWHPIGFFSLRS